MSDTLKIIGCIHLPPLPGSPGYQFDPQAILAWALKETETYLACGLGDLIVENTADIPYLKGQVYPETVSLLAVICHEIRKLTNGTLGLQVLAGANIDALGIAVGAGLDFIRVEGYSFAHIADEGLIQSSAAELMRRRAQLRAQRVRVIADIKKKHGSHAITGDLSLADTARLTSYMEPDGLVLTGLTTGEPPHPAEVQAVRQATQLPLYIGSGVTPQNVADYASVADYVIVGSSFKHHGHWRNTLEPARIRALQDALNSGGSVL